jgi:hypothetical protein
MNLLIMFLLGPTVDVPNTKWDDMFLPSELESYLVERSARATNPGDAIVGPLKVIHAGNRQYPQGPLTYFPFDILAGTAFGVVAIGLSFLFHRKPRLAKSLLALQTLLFGALFGIVGTVLLFFNLFTWHSYTFWNENLFFGNPATLVLVPLAALVMSKRFSWATTWTMRVCVFLTALALIGFVFKALPFSHQDNAVFVRSVIPALSLLAVAWFRIHRASGSTTRKNVS